MNIILHTRTHKTGWTRGNALDLYSEFLVRILAGFPAILTGVFFGGFLVLLGKMPRLCHDYAMTAPFQILSISSLILSFNTTTLRSWYWKLSNHKKEKLHSTFHPKRKDDLWYCHSQFYHQGSNIVQSRIWLWQVYQHTTIVFEYAYWNIRVEKALCACMYTVLVKYCFLRCDAICLIFWRLPHCMVSSGMWHHAVWEHQNITMHNSVMVVSRAAHWTTFLWQWTCTQQ
jgi:hypothetical protein